MFSGLDKAIAADMDHRAGSNALNKALLDTLPEEPERGSYDWWARKCRENTGQSMCDSGIAYGYHYNAPVKPEKMDAVTLHFHDGNLEYPSVSLPHFLTTMYDATDETAMDLERRLYEFADNVPRDSWWDVVRAWLKELEGYEIHDRGFNTYNSDNDLDQVLQADAILVDDHDEEYHILRIHTGCDVRGGYASPVIAKPYDGDYAYNWLADFYCQARGCHAQWEMSHFYSEAIKKHMDRDVAPWDAWRKALQVYTELENGQMRMPNMEGFAWVFHITQADARLVIQEYDRQKAGWDHDFEFEFVFPLAIIETDDGTRFPDPDSFDSCQGADARLFCPECQEFAVGVYSTASGF